MYGEHPLFYLAAYQLVLRPQVLPFTGFITRATSFHPRYTPFGVLNFVLRPNHRK